MGRFFVIILYMTEQIQANTENFGENLSEAEWKYLDNLALNLGSFWLKVFVDIFRENGNKPLSIVDMAKEERMITLFRSHNLKNPHNPSLTIRHSGISVVKKLLISSGFELVNLSARSGKGVGNNSLYQIRKLND